MAIDKVWHCQVSGHGIYVVHSDPRAYKIHTKKKNPFHRELYGLVRGEYKHLMPHFLVSAALPTNYDFQEYAINLY